MGALVPGGLRVAVTGPTGDIGRSLLRALEREPGVSEVVTMGRRLFNAAELGLTKTEYHRGDVLDRLAVEELVRDADVVVHLACLAVGDREETDQINLDGSRTVFEAAVEAGASRLVYASRQRARVEAALHELLSDSATEAYVLRPGIVAGADALALLQNIPYVALFELVRRYQNPLTAAVLDALERFPNLRPVLPDSGTRFQLIHHDDVAEAFLAAVLGRGEPGIYDLAAPPPLTVRELTGELGWYSFPIPQSAVESLAELITRVPLLPAQAQWIEILRQSMLMDTTKAREKLGFSPRHDGRETLREMVQAARKRGLLEP
jgi:UDP-glucose 4-epimerase